VRDTRFKCNFGVLDRFLLIGEKMRKLVKAFTDYFKTRTFQVYNCQKIGLVKYSYRKGPLQSYYYTIDGNNLMLFPADRLVEHPEK
jgi:hypothetical protein